MEILLTLGKLIIVSLLAYFLWIIFGPSWDENKEVSLGITDSGNSTPQNVTPISRNHNSGKISSSGSKGVPEHLKYLLRSGHSATPNTPIKSQSPDEKFFPLRSADNSSDNGQNNSHYRGSSPISPTDVDFEEIPLPERRGVQKQSWQFNTNSDLDQKYSELEREIWGVSSRIHKSDEIINSRLARERNSLNNMMQHISNQLEKFEIDNIDDAKKREKQYKDYVAAAEERLWMIQNKHNQKLIEEREQQMKQDRMKKIKEEEEAIRAAEAIERNKRLMDNVGNHQSQVEAIVSPSSLLVPPAAPAQVPLDNPPPPPSSKSASGLIIERGRRDRLGDDIFSNFTRNYGQVKCLGRVFDQIIPYIGESKDDRSGHFRQLDDYCKRADGVDVIIQRIQRNHQDQAHVMEIGEIIKKLLQTCPPDFKQRICAKFCKAILNLMEPQALPNNVAMHFSYLLHCLCEDGDELVYGFVLSKSALCIPVFQSLKISRENEIIDVEFENHSNFVLLFGNFVAYSTLHSVSSTYRNFTIYCGWKWLARMGYQLHQLKTIVKIASANERENIVIHVVQMLQAVVKFLEACGQCLLIEYDLIELNEIVCGISKLSDDFVTFLRPIDQFRSFIVTIESLNLSRYLAEQNSETISLPQPLLLENRSRYILTKRMKYR